LGKVDAVKRLIFIGKDIEESDYDGRTPLHIAASEG
jgi:ankyrin repeat protein